MQEKEGNMSGVYILQNTIVGGGGWGKNNQQGK